MKIEPANRRLTLAVAVVMSAVLAGVGAWAASSGSSSAAADQTDTRADAQPSVAIETVPVQRGEIGQQVHAYGVVAAGVSNVTSISLPYIVKIRQIRVQPGQRVSRGTPLVVVQADASAVMAAGQAKSAVELARGELERTRALFAQSLATRSQLATAEKALSDAQQADAEQAKLGIASGAKTIASPVAGVVVQIASAQGDQLAAGTTMMQLATVDDAANQHANVMLGVEPADAGNVRPGDPVAVSGLAVALSKPSVEGRVVLVGGAVDPQSQLVDVGAAVNLASAIGATSGSTDGATSGSTSGSTTGPTPLIPGTHVGALITTRVGVHWIVPRDAVLQDGKGRCVYQVDTQGKAHRVPVTLSVESGDRYGVDGALDATRPLVVAGNYELTDGMAVRTGSALASPAGGATR